MIRKLRFKFMLITMSALFLVLALIIGGINIVSYHAVARDADEMLTLLSRDKDMFSIKKEERPPQLPPDLSPEAPFETRYFSVTLSPDSGALIQVDTGHIASVERDRAIEYARTVLQSKKEKGFVDSFRYNTYPEDDAVKIIFLHCSKKLNSFHNFLFASIGISLAGYVLVCSIIAFFSGRIIRPFSESYEKQKRFITDAGHEIKTPLTIIQADTDVLSMELGEENEWLADIKRQTGRLAALTNDLVYLSRMEESADRLQMLEFPFSDMVSETAASFQALAQTQNKELLCEIQPLLSLQGDEKALRQLIGILLDNALKYSPEGDCITLAAERQNKTLWLSVSNRSANPLPRENLQLLFERFYRTDPARSSRTGGYGIGLSIAKAIVTAHGGRILARSGDGETLQIIVSFPL